MTPSSWKGRRRSGSDNLITKSSNKGSGTPRPSEKETATPSTTCSCLGNPTDRGAWRTAAHGVTERQTRLRGWAHAHTLGVSPPKVTHARERFRCLALQCCSRPPPYLGSAAGHCSEASSRFCHDCWPLCPGQRWHRGPTRSPPLWSCGEQWVGTRIQDVQRQPSHGHFFCAPKSHWKILRRPPGLLPRYLDSGDLGQNQESACFINILGHSEAGSLQPMQIIETLPVVSAPLSCHSRHFAINSS